MNNKQISKLMKMYNKMHKLYSKGKLKRAKLYQKAIRLLFSAEIPYSVEIGDNVEIVHGGLGVVFHEKTKIGSNCKIFQNVTIGGMPDGGVPVIGNNVLIGAGAVILGGISIGNFAKIGANAVVLDDVPEFATVVGIPAKVVKISNRSTSDER